jgi:omega-hydroxy-beta-dihydromenaquinone-9 sulfotransferase
MVGNVTIFVAGTGRSGTTQLAEIIGQHPAVWHVPTETRFLVDQGGLEDLVRALSTGYTPFHACDGLLRFRTMLTRDVAGRPTPGALSHVDLTEMFGAEQYLNWAERFLADLTWYEFDERGIHRVVGRYFSDRAELLALCRSYVDELFTTGARAHRKRLWCEKTPNNLLSTGFLWELFPDARIVHIVRHPVQVAASHLSMEWAPDDIGTVCNWLEPMYRRWLATPEAAADPRCIQLRLEDLAVDWPAQRAQLFDRLGLPDAETALEISPDRLVHWAPIRAEDEAYARKRLDFAITAFGYS